MKRSSLGSTLLNRFVESTILACVVPFPCPFKAPWPPDTECLLKVPLFEAPILEIESSGGGDGSCLFSGRIFEPNAKVAEDEVSRRDAIIWTSMHFSSGMDSNVAVGAKSKIRPDGKKL